MPCVAAKFMFSVVGTGGAGLKVLFIFSSGSLYDDDLALRVQRYSAV